MSRKTIMFVLVLLGAVLAFVKTQFGLTVDTIAIIGGLTVISLYIFGEAKLDIQRVGQQAAKFKDPKFWVAFIVAILTALSENGVNLPIPIETIQTILGFILALLFGTAYKKTKAANG